jgi:hypothetical protein
MPFVVLAAGLDWLEGLLPALFVGFWILSQVFALFRRVPQGREPVIVVKPAPPAEQPLPNRERLQKEIEEFLTDRRSGRSQADEQQKTSATRPPDQRARRRAEARRDRGTGEPPRVAEAVVTPPPLPGPAATNVLQPPVVATDIARHVDKAFANDLAHAAPPRGDDIGTVQPAQPAARPPLVALLRDPETIRQAVVLREVLERPTDRW